MYCSTLCCMCLIIVHVFKFVVSIAIEMYGTPIFCIGNRIFYSICHCILINHHIFCPALLEYRRSFCWRGILCYDTVTVIIVSITSSTRPSRCFLTTISKHFMIQELFVILKYLSIVCSHTFFDFWPLSEPRILSATLFCISDTGHISVPPFGA